MRPERTAGLPGGPMVTDHGPPGKAAGRGGSPHERGVGRHHVAPHLESGFLLAATHPLPMHPASRSCRSRCAGEDGTPSKDSTVSNKNLTAGSASRKRRLLLSGVTATACLGAAGYVGRSPIGSWLFTRNDNSGYAPSGVSADEGGICMLTAAAIEGPFFVEGSPLRRDVREDRLGVPMLLRLRIVDHANCRPIPGATIAIWQADALGRYSAHDDMDPSAFPWSAPYWQRRAPATGSRWLRGHQIADGQGMVEFETIFPGWYNPRAPHVHVKALIGGRDRVSTQLYFPQQLSDDVATLAPYRERGPSPYTNRTDFALAKADGAPGAWPRIKRGDRSIRASLTIGIVASQ